MHNNSAMIDEVIEILKQGRDLLHRIGDEIFLRAPPPMFPYGIGSHIRYCSDALFGVSVSTLQKRRVA
jgi:hypothetical protein